ncbi:MAG TPA: hypothetical protein VG455_16540 [Acidimicrobiales bacterium]|nr:hypothetical protein [Acidimicrobiales bacterium]
MVFIPRMAPVALAAAVILAGCGDDDDEATPATSTSTSTTAAATTSTSSITSTTTAGEGVELTQLCTHDERGVRITVRYPQGWHVNDRAVQPCSAFDPDPFELRAGIEFPRTLAVVLRVEPISFGAAATVSGLRVEAERRLTVDGRQAARQEVVSTGEGLGPAGVRSTRYVIDGGAERSILVTTYDVEGNDFERSVDALDAMTAALGIEPRSP